MAYPQYSGELTIEYPHFDGGTEGTFVSEFLGEICASKSLTSAYKIESSRWYKKYFAPSYSIISTKSPLNEIIKRIESLQLGYFDLELRHSKEGFTLNWNKEDGFYNFKAYLDIVTDIIRLIVPDFKFGGELFVVSDSTVLDSLSIIRIDKKGYVEETPIILKNLTREVDCPNCCKPLAIAGLMPGSNEEKLKNTLHSHAPILEEIPQLSLVFDN